MPDTTIRVKEETYKTIVKTRGSFERTFGVKLSLDDSMYLASSYINLVYDEFQNLRKDDLIRIVEKDGEYSVQLSGLNQIAQKVLPRVITSFKNFQEVLKAKSGQKEPLAVISGQVS